MIPDLGPVAPPGFEGFGGLLIALPAAFIFGAVLPGFILRLRFGGGNVWFRAIVLVASVAATVIFIPIATGPLWPAIQIGAWILAAILAGVGVVVSRLVPDL